MGLSAGPASQGLWEQGPPLELLDALDTALLALLTELALVTLLTELDARLELLALPAALLVAVELPPTFVPAAEPPAPPAEKPPKPPLAPLLPWPEMTMVPPLPSSVRSGVSSAAPAAQAVAVNTTKPAAIPFEPRPRFIGLRVAEGCDLCLAQRARAAVVSSYDIGSFTCDGVPSRSAKTLVAGLVALG